tara:strand:+ start:308 stop:517 length:210 start_codon:yes stop_codon:yes gene_type:complete
MEFKIQKEIPIPLIKKKHQVIAENMEVGDSVLVKYDLARLIITELNKCKSTKGKMNNLVRVWKVKRNGI